MLTFLLIVWIVIILLHNTLDYFVTRDGNKPDYVKYGILRSMCAVVHGALVLLLFEDAYTNYSDLKQLLLTWLPYAGYQVLSFWLIYDPVRNAWARGGKLADLIYFDHKEKDSGWVERLSAWAGKPFYYTLKLSALVICIWCIVLIYSRHGNY
jgi:branched-subunit amino acid transport protein AzlD